MNKCPNVSFKEIECQYALSEDSPMPCIATFDQCLKWRLEHGFPGTIDKIKELMEKCLKDAQEINHNTINVDSYGLGQTYMAVELFKARRTEG